MEFTCTVCGDSDDTRRWVRGALLPGLCHTCTFWQEWVNRFARGKPHEYAIIDGTTYSIGSEEDGARYGRGFGGARFVIVFDDGARIVTTNLWHGGEVPERWAAQLPNNARFENGEKWHNYGGTLVLGR